MTKKVNFTKALKKFPKRTREQNIIGVVTSAPAFGLHGLGIIAAAAAFQRPQKKKKSKRGR